MITALRTAIWKDGIKPATGEFELLLAATALALAEHGPGPWSVDAALGQERSGPGWAIAALAAGAAGSTLAVAAGHRSPTSTPAPPSDAPQQA